MPEYQQNQGKPERLLAGYGSVRSAELKTIYEGIDEGTPISQIEERYGRPQESGYETDHIDQCLRFLRTLDMIEETDDESLNPLNQDLFSNFDLSFESRLLYHIRKQSGRQYHLAEIHEVAVEKLGDEGHYGTRRVSVEDLVTESRRNTEYDFKWREEKIEMWANLLAPVGAVSYVTSRDEIFISPSRALLHELLALHQQHRDDGDSLLAALKWIHSEFLPVFSRTGGDPAVHVGVADTFESMVEDNLLTLTGMSDRTETVDLPDSIDNTRTPADYTIDDSPDRPSYWYPLERNERRLKA
ncbi:hypothetical protein [Halorussus halophilus]|uniref:hypothetical protein n=1 Tax=Halorussus halophilus TaxID=2650975 RepID=UPI00130183F9|nr:hypothetical protein [Halorussus halophilus]